MHIFFTVSLYRKQFRELLCHVNIFYHFMCIVREDECPFRSSSGQWYRYFTYDITGRYPKSVIWLWHLYFGLTLAADAAAMKLTLTSWSSSSTSITLPMYQFPLYDAATNVPICGGLISGIAPAATASGSLAEIGNNIKHVLCNDTFVHVTVNYSHAGRHSCYMHYACIVHIYT